MAIIWQETAAVNWVGVIRGQTFVLEPTDSGPAVADVIGQVLGSPIEYVRDLGNSLLVWLSDTWTNVPGLELSVSQLIDMCGSFCRLITDSRAYCDAPSPFSDRVAVRADRLTSQVPDMQTLARQGSDCVRDAGICQPGAGECILCVGYCRSVSVESADCGFAYSAWRRAVYCAANCWIPHINEPGKDLSSFAAEDNCGSLELDEIIKRKNLEACDTC